MHGDAHLGNMMVDANGKVFIVDYGFSTRISDTKQYDFDDYMNLTDGIFL